ncbi:MAG: hypothetical protein LH603_11585 [Pseudonocardia sp.]|nr:hypothetical protein [Pseudonocardia sp.]
MDGGNRPRVARAGIAVSIAATLLLTGACAATGTDPGPSLPTFPTPTQVAAPPTPGADLEGALPDDCDRLLKVADLGALLGLPLDSVGVRTTVGVPAQSVGRTERVACQYSGTVGGPVGGRTLLGLNAAAYVDAAAAEKQWRLNADAEDGDRREMPLGAASAVLIERRVEAVLMVVYGSDTLTVILPEGPRPEATSRADIVSDLALRVLPTLAAMGPAPLAVTDPARAVGASS